jgi:c-di-GMP-binding flagellar brake protein YcgR
MNKKGKRKYNRASTQVLLNVSTLDDADIKTGRAAITDISKGGAGFVSTTKFDEGENVELKFILPGNKYYIFIGVIKRVKKLTNTFSYGIEFKDLNFLDKIELKKLTSKIRVD